MFLTFPIMVIRVNTIEKVIEWRWQNLLIVGVGSFFLSFVWRYFIKQQEAGKKKVEAGEIDKIGLSRRIFSQPKFYVPALIAISVSMATGLLLGMMAGFGPKWLDRILVVCFDTLRSFPTIMFALAIVALTGPSLNTVIGVIIVTSIPLYARIVRTQTQALRHQDFILAERAMGASTARILGHHVLPNIAAPLMILASMDVPAVVGMEAGLSFLGLGVSPPTPSWGSILNDGYSYLRNSPWPIIAGGIPLILVTLGFTFLGESLRDILDPKLRRKGEGS